MLEIVKEAKHHSIPTNHFIIFNILLTQETFIQEVEVLRQELEETEVVIDGEYVSRDTMLNEWKWSENLGLEKHTAIYYNVHSKTKTLITWFYFPLTVQLESWIAFS